MLIVLAGLDHLVPWCSIRCLPRAVGRVKSISAGCVPQCLSARSGPTCSLVFHALVRLSGSFSVWFLVLTPYSSISRKDG